MYIADPMLLEPPRAAQLPEYQSIFLETDRLLLITAQERPLCVRWVTDEDTALLVDLIARLSDRARRLRFFRPLPDAALIEQEAARVTQREPQLGAALVATTHERGQERAVALAELAHDLAAPTTAELAVVVRDDYQRAGVGTLLLRRLIELAPRRDVRALRATFWAENQAVRRLLHNLGLAYRAELRSGELTVWAELP